MLCLTKPDHREGTSKLISISERIQGDPVQFWGCFGLQGEGEESSSVWISQTFTAQAAELNEGCWARISIGYQAVTEHHALSPPRLLSWHFHAQWLLFFPSEPTTPHTQRVMQRQRSNIEMTTPPGPNTALCCPFCSCYLLVFVFEI